MNADKISAIPTGVTLATLDNGLTIIVREDHTDPVISVQAWCSVGSIHEGKWLGAGMSHILEHMLLKGTKTRTGERISQEVQEVGCNITAYTFYDYSVFNVDGLSKGSKVAIDVLCDIMRNASFPEEALAKELDVIRREMDMGADDPFRRSSRRMLEVAFTKSPYRYKPIGYVDLFNQVQRQDIQNYYAEKYTPANVFYVVAGAVKTSEVVSQIKAAYADAPMSIKQEMFIPLEPRHTVPCEVVERAPTSVGLMFALWHIPEALHPDLPAIEVLATILGSGMSSRLKQGILEKGLAHEVDAFVHSFTLSGLFGTFAVIEQDRYDETREAILAEIGKLKTIPVPDAELKKAVKQIIVSKLSARKTLSEQANNLAMNWLLAGDVNYSERLLERIKRVTPADVLRAANKYITDESRTIYAMLPEEAVNAQPDETRQSLAKSIQKITLPNGLRLLVKEDNRLPLVQIRAAFLGSLLVENESNNGISALLSKLLTKGTGTRNAQQLASEIEAIGGSLASDRGNQFFAVTAQVLSDDLAVGIDLVADVVQNPAFSHEAFALEQQGQLAEVQSLQSDLLTTARNSMRKAMFGASGFGLYADGSELM